MTETQRELLNELYGRMEKAGFKVCKISLEQMIYPEPRLTAEDFINALSKLPTIEDATKHFKRVWPNSSYTKLAYRPDMVGSTHYPFWVTNRNCDSVVCTRKQFEDYLISNPSYEYDVEYRTNGQKPDLPDDVEVWYENPVSAYNSYGKVGDLNWRHVSKFRIVDKRAKPEPTTT